MALAILRQPFDARVAQDAIALLREYSVACGASEQIDGAHIARLGARDWTLFHAVYDNLVTLEKVLDKYLEPEEARLVWHRVEALQSELDRAPKSFRWMINQLLRKPTQVPR
jgi:hypothetical protein